MRWDTCRMLVWWTYSAGRNVIYGIYDGSVYLLLQVEHTLMFWGFFSLYLIRRQTDPFMGPPAVCAYAVCSWMLTIGAISSCHSLCTIVPTLCVGVHCAARHTHTLCQCSHYPLLCWSCFISPPLLGLLGVFPWQFFFTPLLSYTFSIHTFPQIKSRMGFKYGTPPPPTSTSTFQSLDPILIQG